MSEDGVLFSKDKTTICAYPMAKEEKSYKIPSTVTSIYDETFFCSMLESIELPASITSIGYDIFYGSQNLSSIVSLNPEPPVCDESSFLDDYYINYDAVTVYVPVGASESYRNAVGWNKFSNIVEGASSIIEVEKNIDNAGVLDLSGSYVIGSEVTLTAMANDGYEFSYWSENGIDVCADMSYTFTVGLSRNIVAIFSPIVNDNEVEVVAEEPNKVSVNLDVEENASGYVVNIYSDETLTCLVATKCYDSAGNIVPQSTRISLTFDGLEIGSYFYEIVVLEESESENIVKSKYVGTFSITESEIECVVENQVGCIVVADGIKVINAGGRSIDVYDLSGHVVAHINVASDNETITLASGMYVVKVEHYVFKLKV